MEDLRIIMSCYFTLLKQKDRKLMGLYAKNTKSSMQHATVNECARVCAKHTCAMFVLYP